MKTKRIEFRVEESLKDSFYAKVKKQTGNLFSPSVVLRAFIIDYVSGKLDPFKQEGGNEKRSE